MSNFATSLDESNRVPSEDERSRDQIPMEQQHGSTPNSRRSSISLESGVRYAAYQEQAIEGTFMTKDHNPTQFCPLLPGESGVTTPDHSQPQNTQHESGSSGSLKSERSAQPETRPKSTHTWRLEIGAAILSLCAMVVLIVLLAHANGRPLDEWRFFLSFNAVISTLSAVARAPLGFVMGSCLGQAKWNWFSKRSDSLLAFEKFEDASRGPMGSLALLSWLRVRHWSALGALLTIALLGFEPFTQAVVNYYGQLDKSEQPSNCFVYAAKHLRVGFYFTEYRTLEQDSGIASINLPTGETMSGFPFFRTPNMGLTAALINGLNIGGTTRSGIPAFYLPENCSWAPYAALAACCTCNDVTSSLTRSSSYGDSRDLGTLKPSTGRFIGNFTTYALSYVSITNPDTNGEKLSSAHLVARAIDNPGNTVSFRKTNTLITAIGIIRAGPSYPGTSWEEVPVLATECALYFCTRASTAVFRDKFFNESIMGSWSERVPRSYQYQPSQDVFMEGSTFADYEAWNNYSLANSVNQQFGFRRSDLQLRIPEEQAREKGLPTDSKLIFNITQSSAETATYAIVEQLFSNGPVTWPLPQKDLGSSQSLYVAQALGMMQTKDYPALFEHMAGAITSFMRDSSTTGYRGEHPEWVIHIRTLWEYMILPLLISTGGCLVLLFAIIETGYRGLEPWKSDVLAVFTHSTNAAIQRQLRAAEVKVQARISAKGLIVKLINSGDDIELQVEED